MSRFTGLQFTGLPCLPVFFFEPTRMPVYRGGQFFHARGAPPAAAHSHTRCCTQHNTTRWVLRAAANTCLHTMPCAAGELCQLSDSTTTPEFSCCGPCGGRLHRICGDPDDDEEVNRICEPCAAAKKSTSSTCLPVHAGIPVYRFALFTGSFWSCHYRPVNRDIDCICYENL